jgi:hypothetical protein
MEVNMAKDTRRWGFSASNRHALRNAEAEIANLERALSAGGMYSMFARPYWRRRLKLEKLLTILERHEKQYG